MHIFKEIQEDQVYQLHSQECWLICITVLLHRRLFNCLFWALTSFRVDTEYDNTAAMVFRIRLVEDLFLCDPWFWIEDLWRSTNWNVSCIWATAKIRKVTSWFLFLNIIGLHKLNFAQTEVKSVSRVWLFVTSGTVAYKASLSMEFSRQEYRSGLPFPSPGDLRDPGTRVSRTAGRSFTIWATREAPNLGLTIYKTLSSGFTFHKPYHFLYPLLWSSILKSHL